MGKLNIAHHKSYHPYRRDNIDRVRRDEQEARAQDAAAEDRTILADSEARIALLRGARAPAAEHIFAPAPAAEHINLFAHLEQVRAPAPAEARGVALAPAAPDRAPWYAAPAPAQAHDGDRRRRERDLARQAAHDPLAAIARELGAGRRAARRPEAAGRGSEVGGPEGARLGREAAERARALELVRRARGGGAPGAGREGGGYGDVFNARAVEEAHRQRARRGAGDGRARR